MLPIKKVEETIKLPINEKLKDLKFLLLYSVILLYF